MKMRLQKDSAQNTLIILQNLTGLLGIRISQKALRYVKHHPDRLTLQFVSNTLTEWGIEAVPLNLTDKTRIADIGVPALAHLIDDGGRFIIITEIKGDSVTFHDPLLGWRVEPKETFNIHWSGVILLIEKLDDEGEVNQSANLKIEREGKLREYFLLTSTFLLCVASLANCSSLPIVILNTLYMLGALLSVMIVNVEFGNSEMVRYCQIGSHLDCASVLNSKGAYVFGIFKASSLGIVWFLGNWFSLNLLLIAAKDNEAIVNHLAILGFLSVGYVPFSLLYQGLVLKRWCVLCLVVQLILVAILSVSIVIKIRSQTPVAFDGSIFVYMLLGFALSIIFWVFTKTLLESRAQVESLEAQVLQFAGDSLAFRHMLQMSEKVPVPDWPKRLTMGRSTNSLKIIMIVKLDCEACAQAVKVLLPFVKRHLDSMHIELVISNKTGSSIHSEIAGTLLSMPDEKRLDAIATWYDKMDYKSFKGQYSLPFDSESVKTLSLHNEWCGEMNITMTPRIIINGNLIPIKYTIEHIISQLVQMISLEEHE